MGDTRWVDAFCRLVAARPVAVAIAATAVLLLSLPGLSFLRVSPDFMNENSPPNMRHLISTRHQARFNQPIHKLRRPRNTPLTTISYHIPIVSHNPNVNFLVPPWTEQLLNISTVIGQRLSYRLDNESFTLPQFLCRGGCDSANAELRQFLRVYMEHGRLDPRMRGVLTANFSHPVVTVAGRRFLSAQLLHKVRLHPDNVSISAVGAVSTKLILQVHMDAETKRHLTAFEERLQSFAASFEDNADLRVLVFSMRFVEAMTWTIVRLVVVSITSSTVAAALAFAFMILRVGPGNVKMFLSAVLGSASLAVAMVSACGFSGYCGTQLVFTSLFPPIAAFLNGLIVQTTMIHAWVAHSELKAAARLRAALATQSSTAVVTGALVVGCLLRLPLALTPAEQNFCEMMPVTMIFAVLHSLTIFSAGLVSSESWNLPIDCDFLFLIPSIATVLKRNLKKFVQQFQKAVSFLCLLASVILPLSAILIGVANVTIGFHLSDFFPSTSASYTYLQFSEAEILNDFMEWQVVVLRPPDFDNETQLSDFEELLGRLKNHSMSTAAFPHDSWYSDYKSYLSATGQLNSDYDPADDAYAHYYESEEEDAGKSRRRRQLGSSSSHFVSTGKVLDPDKSWYETQAALPSKPFLDRLGKFLDIGTYKHHRAHLRLSADGRVLLRFQFRAFFSRVDSWLKRLHLRDFLDDLSFQFSQFDISFSHKYGFFIDQVGVVPWTWTGLVGLVTLVEGLGLLLLWRDPQRTFLHLSGTLFSAFGSLALLSLSGPVDPLGTVPFLAAFFYAHLQVPNVWASMDYILAMVCSWVTMLVMSVGLSVARLHSLSRFALGLVLAVVACHAASFIRLALLRRLTAPFPAKRKDVPPLTQRN